MNILEAKREIANTVRIYLDKDEHGEYVIPIERQRPVLLIGAPGIGKTAIMSSIASELGVGYLGYTITHHTRQSAIGLPFITQKEYGGKTYSVTEYTMSEIVAEVYEAIEKQGKKEGILFIDEINCVSETLAPAMLELLQHKKFGPHRIPDGWILTAAGNPEEYNKSVNELDMVTLDRVKKIEVEPDYEAFKTYAKNNGIHESVLCFISLFTQYLFKAEKTESGFSFVTPRGWEDLSSAIYEYEKMDIPVTLTFISEYVQNASAAAEFYRYYKAFSKYGDAFSGDAIENGEVEKIDLSTAKFEERFTVSELIRSKVNKTAEKAMAKINASEYMREKIKRAEKEGDRVYAKATDEKLGEITSGKYGRFEKSAYKTVISIFSGDDVKGEAAKYETETDEYAKKCVGRIENLLRFGERSLGKGQELTSAVTGMLESGNFVSLITRYDCPDFYRINSELLIDGADDRIKALAKKALGDKDGK